ncbi:SDR family oxidoreductase [Leifsonia poae]|uniref:SDR family oxidoreductase n=1 Tax=Leifsonia poae TaxID=110933 RepID=UPI003D67BC8A
MRIAVAGGTGAVGRHVVEALREATHDPVVLSRSTGTDLLTGVGLVSSLRGAAAVIDVSGTNSTSTAESVRFFGTVTTNLLEAEREVGVPHHIALSVIGARRVNSNYYAGKTVQEEILESSPGGWSLLRTTQFHEFAVQLLEHGKLGPVQIVPTMRSQPIAAAEVAAELVGIAVSGPRGLEPDLAGPQEENMANLVRRYLVASNRTVPVIQLALPGAWGRGMRDGSLLPAADTRLGRQTFDEWLAEQS